MQWTDITTDLLINNYKKNNYKLKTRVYELNVCGIRSKDAPHNTFDDFICGLRLNHGNQWEVSIASATTDPGYYYMEHPANVDGTAILIPGQYVGSHHTGLHKGQYRALVQCGTLRVWRDNNKDDIYDHVNPQDAIGSGINIHHAGENSTTVANWSAACQVFAKLVEFNSFMSEVDDHLNMGYPDLFDYTLFEEEKL